MSGILRLESLTKGNTLKQGDKTPLKYRLFDADGEKLNIAGKTAKVRLVYPDFLAIGYEKDGLTVAQDDTVTFTIDKVIPAKLYHVEIIVDDKFIFPSRADESKFTVDKSSLGTESSIIEIVGVDAVVRKAVDLINKDPNLIIDEDKLVNDIINNTRIGRLENDYYNNFPLINEFENSDFKDGTAGWIPFRALLSVHDDILRATGDGNSGVIQISQNISTLGVHRYHKLFVRVVGEGAQYIAGMFKDNGTSEEIIINSPEIGRWYEIDDVKYWSRSRDSNFSIRVRFPDNTMQRGKYLEIRKPVSIDLTSTFDEPTPSDSTPLPDIKKIRDLLSRYNEGYFGKVTNLYTTKEIYENLSAEIKNIKANKLKLAHWVPDEEPVISKDLSYANFISQYYETLRAEFPQNIKRSVLTNDSSGEYPIYKYVFEPEKYTHTAFLIGGLHGDEYEAVWSLYNLLWHVYNKPTTDERLKYVRSSVRLIVIPVANPWGYERGIRHNSNNVDPNRNFDVLKGFEGSVGTPFDQKEALAIKTVADQYDGEIDLFIDNHTSPPHAGEAGSKYVYTVMRPDSPLVEDAQGELVYFNNYWNDLMGKNLPPYWKYTNNSNSTNYMYMERGVPALTVEFVSINFDEWLSKAEMTRAYEWFGNINLKLLNNIAVNKIKQKDTLKVYPDLGTDIYRLNYSKGKDFELVVSQTSGATIAINATPTQTYQTTLLIDCRKSGDVRFNKSVAWSQSVSFSVGNLYQVSLNTFDGGATWFGTLLGSWTMTYTDVTDNFNRANSDDLGTTVTGELTWHTHTGTGHKILSNALVAKTTGKQVSALTLPSADFELTVDIEWHGLAGLIIRGKGTDYYRLTMGTSKLGFYTSGDLEIQTVAFAPVTGTTYQFKVRAEGEVIIVYVDDTEVMRYADTDKTSHTEVGLMSYNAPETKFDNLEIEQL